MFYVLFCFNKMFSILIAVLDSIYKIYRILFFLKINAFEKKSNSITPTGQTNNPDNPVHPCLIWRQASQAVLKKTLEDKLISPMKIINNHLQNRKDKQLKPPSTFSNSVTATSSTSNPACSS